LLGAGNLHERAKHPAQNPTDFDKPVPEVMNDRADDLDYDAAFQIDSDARGLCALENLIRQLESVGPMSHEEIADAVESLPLPQQQAGSFQKSIPAMSVKQALEVI
jgi:hypothetical protein